MKLKQYQTQSLDKLANFFKSLATQEVKEAFNAVSSKPYVDLLNKPNVPTVTIRIPTGGGKTLMASHTPAIVTTHFLEKDPSVILWLVPSEPIEAQTFNSLVDPEHHNHKAAKEYFGDRLVVKRLSDMKHTRHLDFLDKSIIVISTVQALNITDRSKRNIYVGQEELWAYFSMLSPDDFPYLEKGDANLWGEDHIVPSIGNLLAMHNPLIINDEGHKFRTMLAFDTLARLNPSAIIEFTATPGELNNVLHSVSALELKNEGMIKLPLYLSCHEEDWESAMDEAVVRRNDLEKRASNEKDVYIRPIMLIQAQNKNGDLNVSKTLELLQTRYSIPREQIALATGDHKDLNDVDLFSDTCQIRYVITIEALVEGWDCSFAYVLLSLQDIHNNKDGEQLAGRVLRQPFATQLQDPLLNCAYAHVISADTHAAFKMIENGLISAGISPQDAQEFIRLDKPGLVTAPTELSFTFPIANQKVAGATIKTSANKTSITIPAGASATLINQIKQDVLILTPPEHREKIEEVFTALLPVFDNPQAPFLLGKIFPPVPQICYQNKLLDKRSFQWHEKWQPLPYSKEIQFATTKGVSEWKIDLGSTQITREHVPLTMFTKELLLLPKQEDVLIGDIGVKVKTILKYVDYSMAELNRYIGQVIDTLVDKVGLELINLLRNRNKLADAIAKKISAFRELRLIRIFETNLKHMHVDKQIQFVFGGEYNVSSKYKGSMVFKKHFYPNIDDLDELTSKGKETAQFKKAKELETDDDVVMWIRIIPSQPEHSFYLPLPNARYYPDFIALLKDGRLKISEIKGRHLVDSPESLHKKAIGNKWAQLTGNIFDWDVR